ncbi:hypothetical protein D3C80_2212160 [compost metagenome]
MKVIVVEAVADDLPDGFDHSVLSVESDAIVDLKGPFEVRFTSFTVVDLELSSHFADVLFVVHWW